MKKSELKKIVENKVDEAWYNDKNDLYHTVGKLAVNGALAAGALTGGAYALDKGLEQQERYEQQLNQQAKEMSYGSQYHYEDWCKEHQLDPNSQKAERFYEDWCEEQMNEDKIRYAVRRALVENIVRNKLSEAFGFDSHYSVEPEVDTEKEYNAFCNDDFDDGKEYEHFIEDVENGRYDSHLESMGDAYIDRYFPDAESYGAKEDMLKAVGDRLAFIKQNY